jgi:hypothetical protein
MNCAIVLASEPNNADSVIQYASQHLKDYDEDLLQLGGIPSISSLPEHTADITKASKWLFDRLKVAGLEV